MKLQIAFAALTLAICSPSALSQQPAAPPAPIKLTLDQIFEKVAVARKGTAPKNVAELQQRLTTPEVCGRIIRQDSQDMCAILIYLHETPSGDPVVRVAPLLFLDTERITTGTLLEETIWKDAKKANGLRNGMFEGMFLKELLKKPVSGNDPATGKPLKGDFKLIAVLGMAEAEALGIPKKYRERTGWTQ